MAKNKATDSKKIATQIMVKNRSQICGDSAVVNSTEKEDLRNLIDENLNQIQVDKLNKDKHQASVFDLWNNKHMRYLTLNLMFSWFTNSMVYFGLALNAGKLPGSDIFNNFMNGILEVPAYLIFPILLEMKFLGRKLTLSYFLIFTGICCLISTILIEFQDCSENKTYEKLGQLFAYAGKFAVSGTYGVDYTIAGEVYPSEIRSIGLAVCTFAATLAGSLSPFILSLQGLVSWLPGVIFSILAVSAGIFSFWLPETRGQPMLTTIQETEKLYFSEEK